jgi:hypothetical protein
VAALLDESGRFVRIEMQPVRQGRITSVWLADESRRAGREGRFDRVFLNTSGALRGDGSPSVAVNPLTGLPWAVWAFNEDGDYEIALSLFDGRYWSAPILLGGASNGADDLGPQLLFTPQGRPLIVWWQMSADGARQTVQFSSRVQGRWMAPVRLTSARAQSRRPAILVKGEELILAYEGEKGIEMRAFSLNEPRLGGHAPTGGDDGPDPPAGSDTRPPDCQLIGCSGD